MPNATNNISGEAVLLRTLRGVGIAMAACLAVVGIWTAAADTANAARGRNLCECFEDGADVNDKSKRKTATCEDSITNAGECGTWCVGQNSAYKRSKLSSNHATCTGESAGGGGSTSDTRTLTNPISGARDFRDVVARIIRMFTGLSGSVALLMFVWGSILWMTSGGSEERITKGKKAIVWATIGLAVIFGAYAILSVLFRGLGASL